MASERGALQPSDIRGFDGLKGTKIPHRKGKRKQKEEMVETECHDVCVSCTGVDTLHQLTPCCSLFGLDYQHALHSSPWQQNGKGKNTEKSSVIHRQQETHTPVYTNMHAHKHSCAHMHTHVHVYNHTCTHTCAYIHRCNPQD